MLSFRLPDIHGDWPFPRTDNPHYFDVALESLRWFESFKLFSPDRQRSFEVIMPGLLASMAYPNHSRTHFRTTCDLMAILFAVDEISDHLSPEEAKVIADSVLDALNNPDKETDKEEDGRDHRLAELHRSFWSRTLETASSTAKRRFIKSYEDYVRAMTQEARDRRCKSVRKSISDYLELRRYTGAIKPSFDMLLLPLEISDEVLNNPIVKQLEIAAIDMVAVANDIVSFNVEQARHDIHNLIIVLMDGDERLTIQMAMDVVGEWYKQRCKDFIECLKQLPKVENGNDEICRLHQYAQGLGNWVTANYEWSFESHRFFGGQTWETLKCGVVKLLPKSSQLVDV